MIPFVDLKAQYKSIQTEIDTAINNVINENAFISGNYAAQFEKDFAHFLGVKNCISCANGTDSIEILLKAMGIGNNDEVLVPAVSWISTSEAVSSVGAKPIFVDIDNDYYTIDLDKIEAKINPRTKAIIPVHLYGQPVNMERLMLIAKKHQLKVLEDCAQAHGAEFNKKKIGTFGDCASFSFYPGKNLGAYGDAGAMATNNDELAKTAKMIANHGQEGKHNHLIEGRNSRMDGLQAAILSVKLNYLNYWTNQRIKNAEIYDSLLKNTTLQLPSTLNNGKHVYHLYVIRHKKRDEIKSALNDNEIDSAIHYPTALPFLNCYKSYNHKLSDFPVASQFQKEILSIPMFPELDIKRIDQISKVIKNVIL